MTPGKRSSAQQRERAIVLLGKGLSREQIAQRLGVNRVTVHRWLMQRPESVDCKRPVAP